MNYFLCLEYFSVFFTSNMAISSSKTQVTSYFQPLDAFSESPSIFIASVL